MVIISGVIKRFKITFTASNNFVKFAVHIYTLGSTS